MGDNEMKEILENLKLPELIDIFERNEITKEVLKNLNEKMITELIPVIGKRAIFLNFWKQYCESNEEILMDNIDDNIVNKKKRLESNTITSKPDSSQQCTIKKNLSSIQFPLYEEFMIPLTELLGKNKAGQRILTYYESNNELCEKLRCNLCEIIISYIEDSSPCMTNNLAECISTMIIETFPSEVKETYFIPPIKKKHSVTNKSIPSRGKLMTMWRNRQYKNNVLHKKINEEKKQFESIVEEENDNEYDNELLKETMQWLQCHQAPWELVLENWKKCYSIRMKDLQERKDKDVSNIFNKWMLYKHPQGYELIAMDFENMKITEVNLTFDVWLNFFETVKQNTSINNKNDDVNLMLQQIESTEITKDAKAAIILQLLPHFIPPRKIFVSEKRSHKPSIGAAKDSMIKHANIAGDMLRLKFETRKYAETLKIPVQPYIITIGDYKTTIDVYVSVDETLYKVNSTIEAIDICFKVFHVFQLKYPGASEHLWMLIQKGIYNFTTKWDFNISFIAYVLKKLHDRTQNLRQ